MNNLKPYDPSTQLKLEQLDGKILHFVYISLINMELIEHSHDISLKSSQEKISAIKHLVRRDPHHALAVIENIFSSIENLKIDNSHFSWLDKKDARACIFAWLNTRELITSKSDRLIDKLGSRSLYDILMLPHQPGSAAECYEIFITFVTLWETNESEKILFVENVKKLWSQASAFKHKSIKLLLKYNDDQVKWFYSKLVNKLERFEHSENFLEIFKEKLEFVLAAIDHHFVRQTELKRLFFEDVYNSVWKHSKNPSELTGMQYWIRQENVLRLRKLSEVNKLSEKETLEMLIADAYLKLKK